MSDDVERVEITTIGGAARGERSFIEVPPARVTVKRTTEAQDYADGAALRRLREALGDRKVWTTLRHYNYATNNGIPFYVEVEDFEFRVRGNGQTIAEAADKCREALAPTRNSLIP